MVKVYKCGILGVEYSRRDMCVEGKGCDGLRGYRADEINVSKRIDEGVV